MSSQREERSTELVEKTPGLRIIDIEQVTTAGRSAVYCEGNPGVTPVIMVHGIMDTVRRWVSSEDERTFGIRLIEFPPPPMFHLSQTLEGKLGRFPAFWKGPGLLATLCRHRIPAVAFTYQDSLHPIANMCDAVTTLHRMIDWAKEHWKVSQVDLIGHSRGGLVIRHALCSDSSVMRAREACKSTRHVIALCSPFGGSKVANVVQPIVGTIEMFERMVSAVSQPILGDRLNWLHTLNPFRQFILNLGQLAPESEEVVCLGRTLPEIRGQFFAIAGSDPRYFSCDIKGLGTVRLPPSLFFEELMPGAGDLVVAVRSALNLPVENSSHHRVLPVNHVSAPFDPAVQEQIVRWLSGIAPNRGTVY